MATAFSLFAEDFIFGKKIASSKTVTTIASTLSNVSKPTRRDMSLKYALDDLSVNGTIFFTICNKGMAVEWLQQWYVSARRVGIANIFVVATDNSTYDWVQPHLGRRVLNIGDLIPLLRSDRWRENQDGHDSESAFNWRSEGYEQVVVQRATIIRSILERTSSDLVYSDTDIHWLRNPQARLRSLYAQYHFCLQREKGDELGDYNCSGFMYLKNTPLTRQFLSMWEVYIKQRLLKKGFFTDQEEINKLLRDLVSRKPSHHLDSSFKSSFRACTFDWDHFPSGINYFYIRKKGRGKFTKTCTSKKCKDLVWHSRSRGKQIKSYDAYLVHHNFAKSNMEKKKRAKEHGLWLDLDPDDWYD